MASVDEVSLIVDHGTYMMKAGYSGDDGPRAVFPTIVKRPRMSPTMVGMGFKDAYVGDEYGCRGRSTMVSHYPIVDGEIVNWDNMEKIYHHTFYNELRVAPEEHYVMLSDSPTSTTAVRRKLTQIMFEVFNTPGINLVCQQVLCCVAYGRQTGVVLDVGHSRAVSVPIYELSSLPQGIQSSLTLSGEQVTDHIVEMLQERGHSLYTPWERDQARNIKETLCAVTYPDGPALPLTHHEMPDGCVIEVDEQCRSAPGVLFTPKEGKSAQQMVVDSITSCQPALKNSLCEAIMVAGGGSYFAGFSNRLEVETFKLLENYFNGDIVTALRTDRSSSLSRIPGDVYSYVNNTYLSTAKKKIYVAPERKYSSWIGASILSGLSTHKNQWLTKEEYDEMGAKAIELKCF